MKNMDYGGWLSLLFEKWKFLSAVIASLLMDLVFLLVWSVALLGFDKVVDYIDPTGSHKLISAVKVIFELSTLAVVVAFAVSDIIKVVARIRAENRKQLGEGDGGRELDRGE